MHVRPTPWNQLKIGDIVVVDASVSKFPIMHRIIGWQRCPDTSFGLLKGDNLTHKDRFVLSQDNYSGKVWARERNGKRVLLQSFPQRMLARFLALLSIWNSTPGLLRFRMKKNLGRIIPRIPGITTIERFFLQKARYFFFSTPANTRRLWAIYRGKGIGEIVFQDTIFTIKQCTVFSPFSLFISSERFAANAQMRFPEIKI